MCSPWNQLKTEYDSLLQTDMRCIRTRTRTVFCVATTTYNDIGRLFVSEWVFLSVLMWCLLLIPTLVVFSTALDRHVNAQMRCNLTVLQSCIKSFRIPLGFSHSPHATWAGHLVRKSIVTQQRWLLEFLSVNLSFARALRHNNHNNEYHSFRLCMYTAAQQHQFIWFSLENKTKNLWNYFDNTKQKLKRVTKYNDNHMTTVLFLSRSYGDWISNVFSITYCSSRWASFWHTNKTQQHHKL